MGKRIIVLLSGGLLFLNLFASTPELSDLRLSHLDELRKSLTCRSWDQCKKACLKALKDKQVRVNVLSNCFGIANAPISLDFSFPVVSSNDEITVSIVSNVAYVVVGDGRQLEPYCQRIEIDGGGNGDDLKTAVRTYKYVYPVGFDDCCLCAGVSIAGDRSVEDVRYFRFQLNWLDDRSLGKDSYWGDDSSIRAYRIMARTVRQILGRLRSYRRKDGYKSI